MSTTEKTRPAKPSSSKIHHKIKDHVTTHIIKDVIDEASLESFPASDPPCWTTGNETIRNEVKKKKEKKK